MLYPFKFDPVFKDYIWGGRELQKLGKNIPEGITAESWEICCHKDGVSRISNGEFKGVLLPDIIKKSGREIMGSKIYNEKYDRFPLLIKFIDANNKLSVQVHPDDEYARVHENGELGKNEMWYIISSKPGAKLIYGIPKGVTKDEFAEALRNEKLEEYMNEVEVFPGDVLNIPSGMLHAIGSGILLAEIQQNSNTTYRVYDYNRVDKSGKKRPLHVEKALEVIDFSLPKGKPKAEGLKVKLNPTSDKTYKIANKYFSVEVYDIEGTVNENADGTRFFIYVFVDGEGYIKYNEGTIHVQKGESVLIPASLGAYSITGNLKALKTYVPDVQEDVLKPLQKAGYSLKEIYEKVEGIETGN